MKKRIITMLLVICMVVSPIQGNVLAEQEGANPGENAANPFADVKKGDWYYDAVLYVNQNGLFNGTGETTFDPDGTMTRGMFVTVLGRMAGVKTEQYIGKTDFSDVPETQYFAPYVAWAAKYGITDGTGNNQFSPNALINREQMAAFFVRYFETFDVDYETGANITTTPADIDSVAPYAREAVLKLWRLGLLNGDGINFNPTGNASRAQTATLCKRTDETVDTWYSEPGVPSERTGPSASPGVSATYYTFKFESNDGTTISDRSLREGRLLNDLPIPYKADSIFVGWCYDPALTELVESSDTAQESCILYAKYESMLPLNEDEQTPAAIALDAGTDFSVQILSADSRSVDELKEDISAKNLSSNQDKEWFSITKTGSNTFTVSGLNYSGEGGAAKSGFVEGAAYKITLEDDKLTFAGQDASTRIYNFTIERKEVVNVGLSESLKKIPITDISGLTVNGMAVSTVSIPVITIGQDGSQSAADSTDGSFTYTKASLYVGDTVVIYKGDSAPSITMDSAIGGENAAYVEITAKDGNRYTYKTAQAENILFTPDVLPVSTAADTDGDAANNSITVPISAMTYTDDRYALAGLDSQTTVDEGDFIAFYSGTLQDDGILAGGKTEAYAQITSVKVEDESYIVSYTPVSLGELQDSMAAYQKDSMDGDALLEGEDTAEIERRVELQARNSGFADEAGMYLASLALETDSFTHLSEDYELKSIEMQMNGEPITQETLRLMGSTEVEVELSKLMATLNTSLVHFEGLDGLRLTLEVGVKITITTSKAQIEIEVTGLFEQEVRVDIGVDGNAVWSWWGIFPYISEYEVNAYVDFYTYTGIGIEATIVTKEKEEDEGFGTGNEELEKIGKQIKDLMDKKDKYLGDGKSTVSDSLEEKYASMLENESDWVNLFEKSLKKQEATVLAIIAISFEIKFVVSANMNISLGVDFWYENAKRYVYTLGVFSEQVQNEVIDLVEEHYEFEFYVMGTMGLRAGIKLEFKIGLFSTDFVSVGFSAEAGAYVRVWGYFYYQLSYHANATPQKTSSYSGALLFELGVYIEITFEAQALKGTFKYNPTLYANEWPIWSAGVRENVRDFAYTQGDAPNIKLKQYITTTQLPNSALEMAYLDLKEGLDDGELFTAIYDSEGKKDALTDSDPENNDDEANFKITMTNKAFSYDPITNQITVTPGGKAVQKGEMVITWITQPLAFSSAPLERRISLYWDNLRDGYVIAPNANGGSYVPIMLKKYQEAVSAPESPTKTGYTFVGWFSNSQLTIDYTFPETMPNTDTNIYAKWAPATDTVYTVEYYQQILGSSQYALEERETLRGTTDSTVTPLVKSYKGYRTPEQQSLIIKPDGSAVLRYYYDLQTYTVTFKPGDVGGSDEVTKLKYGSTITAPQFAAKGYIFTGWDQTVSTYMGDRNLTYTARWEKDTGTEYRVEYYVQQSDGRYVLQDIAYQSAKTGDEISAVALRRDGIYEQDGAVFFKDVTVKGEPAESVIITGDGKTVIKVNYRRAQYNVTFKPANGSEDIVYTLYSGAAISAPTVTRLGYAFADWTIDVQQNIGIENLSYTARWMPVGGIAYTVRHIREDLSGQYPTSGELVEIETKHGVTEDDTAASARSYDGFTVITFEQTDILPDGSAEVEIKYGRNSYAVTWYANGTEYRSGQVKHGAEIIPPTENPTMQGYVFATWQGFAQGATMGISAQSFTATWTPATDTGYTVKHIREDLNENYTIVDTETKTGVTEAQTAAAAKNYEGFTAGSITQTEILPDGSAVVVIRYSRNSYTAKWIANGQTHDTLTFRYGQTVTIPAATPVNKTGYTFKEWLSVPATMPARNISLTADWTANTYTVSFNGNGGSSHEAVTVTYDSAYGPLPTPTLDGYIFNGWTNESGTTMTAETVVKTAGNHILKAVWAASDSTAYTVRHYKQNTAGDGYTQAGDDVSMYGETDTNTAAVANSYEGFAAKAFDQVNIDGDGTAVVSIYYDRIVHKVTWDIDGTHTVQNYRFGATITPPAAARIGYTSTGWNVEPETVMPNNDLTYTAQWTANTYSVSFDGNGGNMPDSISVTYHGEYPALTESARTGYTFGGWYTAASGGTQIKAGDAVSITAAQTLYAHWSANIYNVCFNLNGGNGTVPDNITVTYDASYSNLPENTAVKIGHSFDGWYTAASGGTKVERTTTAATARDHTLYVHWKIDQHTIRFDSAEGTSVIAITADYDAQISAPTAPTREGYSFAGWKLGEELYSFTTMPAEDLTLTAQWTKNKYTISFISSGTSVTAITADYGASVSKPAADPTRTGYTFAGWKLGDTAYAFTTMPADNIVLTAAWTTVDYPISYVGVDGIAHNNPASYTIESDAINLSAPTGTKTGYAFAGWYTDASFVDTSEVGAVAISNGSTGVKTFHAKWTANQYFVTFDDNTGLNNNKPLQPFTYDQPQALNTIDSLGFINAGYTFTGWKTAEDGTGTEYTDGQSVKNLVSEGSITLYAQWTPINYTISYSLGFGAALTDNPTVYNITTADIALSDPSGINLGYQFLGWYDGGTKVTSIHHGSTGNKELTAKWAHGGTFSLAYMGTIDGTSTYRITRTIPAGAVPTTDVQNIYFRTVNGTAIGGTESAVHFKHVGGESVFATFTGSDINGSYKDFTVTGENANAVYTPDSSTSYISTAYTSGENRSYNVELYKITSSQSLCTGALDTRTVTRTLTQNSTRIVTPSLYQLQQTLLSHAGGKLSEDNFTGTRSMYTAAGDTLLSKYTEVQQGYLSATGAKAGIWTTFNYRDESWLAERFMQLGSGDPSWFSSSLSGGDKHIVPAIGGGTKYSVDYGRAVGSGDTGEVKTFSFPNFAMPASSYTYQIFASAWASDQDSSKQYITIGIGDKPRISMVHYQKEAGYDSGYVSSVYIYGRALDTAEPTQVGIAPMAEGVYRRGDTISISVVYNEIVANSGSAALGSISGLSLSNVNYVDGVGTNVLHFTATVNQDSYEVNNTTLIALKPVTGNVSDMVN